MSLLDGTQRKVISKRPRSAWNSANLARHSCAERTGKTTLINMDSAGLENTRDGEITRECRGFSFPLGFHGRCRLETFGDGEFALYRPTLRLDPDYVEAFLSMASACSEEYFDMPVGTYSQGMRARFSFAFLLASTSTFTSSTKDCRHTDFEFNKKAGFAAARAPLNARP